MTARRPRLSARLLAAAAVLGILAASTLADTPVSAAAAAGGSTVTVSKTVARTFLDSAGNATTAAKNTVSVTVDQTKQLRSLQLIHVSWAGAIPTGGLVADPNSDQAQNEEHPLALFECRGTDSAADPLTPDTCWTQYADERFAGGTDDPPYPGWRADSAATAAQRAAVVDAPTSVSAQSACRPLLYGVTTQRWVPFTGADGTVYPGGPFGCAGQPAEAASVNLNSSLALPSNETFGVTSADGTGSADFDVFTAEDHASLGCSQSVPCSLVAVPIEGLSCDPYGTLLPASQRPDADGAAAARAACEAGPDFAPGQTLPSQENGEPAVSGALWWSPSNWANRISIPLTFAPPDDACALTGSGDPVDVYGSEMMIQASTQWAPHFCLDKNLFDFTHVQTPEPQARNLLAIGNIEAAFTSYPPDPGSPYPSPTVNAPVAVTGWGIAFSLDDAKGRPVTSLKLDARLLAKLLTESYPADNFIKDGDPGLQNNPLNITQDPEFQALNPGVQISTQEAAATLLALNTDSDVMTALTSYINADPDARAWLNGAPDPWGMTVNPNYQNIALPVDNWPLLDTYEPLDEYKPGRIDCLENAPVPYLPLVAAPTARLYSIAQDMQFSLAQTQTKCVLPSPIPGSTDGAKMVATGRQAAGHHAMFGLVSLGDAERDGLNLAQLETYTAPLANQKFSDATGRSFASPDTQGLLAASHTLQADPSTGVWPVPYDTLRADSQDADAYPGTMVVYAAVPTRGLPAGDGARYATLLEFAAGVGQQPGADQGQLPAGYLPMTSADGLGQLAAYTRRAALAVGAQRGYLPSLTQADPTQAGPGAARPSGTRSSNPVTGVPAAAPQPSTGYPVTGASGSSGPSGVRSSAASASQGASSSPAARTASTPSTTDVALRTQRIGSGVGSWALPVALLLAIAALAGWVAVRIGTRGR